VIGTSDDFNFEMRQDIGEPVRKKWPLIGAVCKQLLEKWKQTFHRGQQRDAAIAVLNDGGMNDGMEQQTYRIYEYMALLALDLFARIVRSRAANRLKRPGDLTATRLAKASLRSSQYRPSNRPLIVKAALCLGDDPAFLFELRLIDLAAREALL
jgi:hypothetical protein